MAFTRKKGMSEERRHRSNQSLALRRDGKQYWEIGEITGVSTTTAYNDVQLALKEITRENAEELLQLELARLDDDQVRLTDALDVATKAAQGEELDIEKWAASVARLIAQRLAVSDRRARLLGLDKVKPDESKVAVEAFNEMMATLRNRHPRGD